MAGSRAGVAAGAAHGERSPSAVAGRRPAPWRRWSSGIGALPIYFSDWPAVVYHLGSFYAGQRELWSTQSVCWLSGALSARSRQSSALGVGEAGGEATEDRRRKFGRGLIH